MFKDFMSIIYVLCFSCLGAEKERYVRFDFFMFFVVEDALIITYYNLEFSL